VLVSTAKPDAVAAMASRYGTEAPMIGVTIEKEIEIRLKGRVLGRWQVASLQAVYDDALESHVR
jgi:hypothetical protein